MVLVLSGILGWEIQEHSNCGVTFTNFRLSCLLWRLIYIVYSN